MNRVAIAVASVLAVAPAFAQYDGPYRYDRSDSYRDREVREFSAPVREEYARVISSTPVYASNREECWNPQTGQYEERRDRSSSRIGAGTAVGAVAGGVLGHQVDEGAGTAIGAILGGLLGHEIEKRQGRDDDLDYSRCRVAQDTSNVENYEVTYRFKGQDYTTTMSYDPGPRLLVGQDVNWDGTPFS